MNGKKFYLSKTFWINLIGIVAIIVQSFTKFVITPETQVLILSFVNMILRAITKEPIQWTNKN